MKTVLFGLDGATYTVLDHLMALGVMPNLTAFCKSGSRAVLHSTPTPLTPQAWTTLATGRSPGHHGIFDFLRVELGYDLAYFRINNARDIHGETVWHYASRHGKRVTLLNYILTSPPEPLNGHVVPGWVSGRHLRRLTHPKDLFARLQGVSGLDVKALGAEEDFEGQGLRELAPELWSGWIQEHIRRDQLWFGVMDHLMVHEPSDLTAIVFDGVDKIQHLAYRYLDPAHCPVHPSPWETEIIDLCQAYFRQIDEFLGRTLARVGRWGRVFIVSDHGFTATQEIVYINKWLHDLGMLTWKERLPEDQQKAHFHDDLTRFAAAFDLTRTKAYALFPSSNGIFLVGEAARDPAFRRDLVEKLYQLQGADGGQVVVDVQSREDCFPGPWCEQAPHLTLRLRDCGFISVLNASAPVIPRVQPVGTHHPHGILLARGPGIREGATVRDYSLLDIAPLLLHSLGLEIPTELEGVFPEDLYDADYLGSDPPRRCQPAAAPALAGAPIEEEAMSKEEEAAILERLRGLGYIE